MKLKKIKPIFMLWFQGWGQAPPICKACVRSWKQLNPGWQVVLLDCHTLPAWCNWRRDIPNVANKTIQRPAVSDIVRLKLLKEYGGVWADATTFCTRPIDDWLPDDPFFAFSNADPNKRVSSWFLKSDVHGSIVQIWDEAVTNYWSQRDKMDNYFWVHQLFASLVATNREFNLLWQSCRPLPNKAPHFFHRMGFNGSMNEQVEEEITRGETPLYKLTWKNGNIHTKPRMQFLFDHVFKKT